MKIEPVHNRSAIGIRVSGKRLDMTGAFHRPEFRRGRVRVM